MTDEAATWFGLGLITQVGVRAANHTLGDDVVVIGSGVIGQLIVQYARLLGARTVVVIDPASSFRLAKAETLGATHTISLPVSECREAVAEATKGRMASVVYDATGHAAVFRDALALARDFGTVVLIGDTGSPSGQTLSSDLIRRGLRVVGAHDGHPPTDASRHTPWNRQAMADLFFEYVRRGDLRVDDLISHRFQPDEAAHVYKQLTEDRSQMLGVLFDWT